MLLDNIVGVELINPRHVHCVGELGALHSPDRKDESKVIRINFCGPDLQQLCERFVGDREDARICGHDRKNITK